MQAWKFHSPSSSRWRLQAQPASSAAVPSKPAPARSTDGPADVAPHVLVMLATDTDADTAASSTGQCVGPLPNGLVAGQQQQQQRQMQQQRHHQQQQMLLPRTYQRLQGMQLPGFMSDMHGLDLDPQLLLWQRQALSTWQAAAAWAQQHRHRRGVSKPRHQHPSYDDQQQYDPPVLQEILTPSAHWAQTAAVIAAAGDLLQLHHLSAMLHHLSQQSGFDCSSFTHSSSSSSSSGSTGNDARASSHTQQQQQEEGAFQLMPSMIAVNVVSGKAAAAAAAAASPLSLGGDVDRPLDGQVVVLKRTDLLPHITSLLHKQLEMMLPPQEEQQQQQQQQQQQHKNEQPHQQQRQQHRGPADVTQGSLQSLPGNLQQQSTLQPSSPAGSGNTTSNDITNSSSNRSNYSWSEFDGCPPVAMLQQLAGLQTFGQLGAVNQDCTAVLLSCVRLPACQLSELTWLLLSCAALGHPLRASWLGSFTDLAMDKWQQVLAAADAAVDAAANDPGGCQTAFAGDAVLEMQQLPVVLVRLLDGLARYPGNHIKPAELTQLLQSIPLHQLQVQELQQLLIATAALQLQPSRGWWEAAAAAVAVLLPCCSVSEQALLLVGLTAGGYQPEQHWWRTWFEETASSCAELEMAAGQLVLSRVQGKPGEPSPQGPAEVSAGTALGAGLAHSGRQLATSSSNTSAAAAAQQGGTARLTAALLLDVLQLLCQLELQPEEAWLAAVLRSHLRTAYEVSAVPELLLLSAELLQHPQSFATRHKALFSQLIMPVQQHMHELSAEQLTQAIETVAAYSLKVGVDWLRWHAAAVLRMGKVFPLECLVRVRDSYRFLQFAPEDRMQALLGTVNWRVKQRQQRQQHQEKMKQQGAVLFGKNEQRRSQNERDKAAREAKIARKASSTGGAPGPSTAPSSTGKVGPAGKQQWRTRKLRLPGTLDRKF